MITTKTRTVTREEEYHVAECELCSADWEVSADEAQVGELPDREPLLTVTFEGADVHVHDLCPNCQAFIRDRLDSLLTPLTLARRFTAKDATQDDPPAKDEPAGAGAGEGGE
jgi:hypothetical protein